MQKQMNPAFFKKTLSQREEKKRAIKLNNAIIQVFKEIEEEPDKTPQKIRFLKKMLRDDRDSFNPANLATLFNQLSKIFLPDLSLCIEITSMCVKYAERILKDSHYNSQFTIKEIAQIVNSLPKLVSTEVDFDELLNLLFKKTLMILKKNVISLSDKSLILEGMAKMNVDLNERFIQKLIGNLLPTAEVLIEKVDALGKHFWSQLWQFLMFTKVKDVKSARVEKLLPIVEEVMESQPKVMPSISFFQKTIYRKLSKILNEEYLIDMKEEYQVGSYTLDIAFPTSKLNIEVDGRFHYCAKNHLRRSDVFRDNLLVSCYGWRILRIPYYEWESLLDIPELQMDYLITKLKDYSEIFNSIALARLEALEHNTIESELSKLSLGI